MYKVQNSYWQQKKQLFWPPTLSTPLLPTHPHTRPCDSVLIQEREGQHTGCDVVHSAARLPHPGARDQCGLPEQVTQYRYGIWRARALVLLLRKPMASEIGSLGHRARQVSNGSVCCLRVRKPELPVWLPQLWRALGGPSSILWGSWARCTGELREQATGG